MSDSEKTALLFHGTLPPVVLKPGVRTTIGRHSESGFCIRHDDVSRQHAEVGFRDGRWWVRDLGSTNGTWMQGAAVAGERALESGDRIELGSCVVVFCEVARDTAASTRTGLLAAPSRAESFKGGLAELPAAALFQLVEMGAKTGQLDILSSGVAGRIWFEAGRPVHAETEKNSGFDAALALVAIADGHFRFQAGEPPPERTIEATVAQVLAELARAADGV